MPTIAFVANDLGAANVVEAPEGGPLLDICDAAHAPVEFSCRSASCGTCRVHVLQGAELLLPAQREEREVLELFGGSSTERLACRAIAIDAPGLIQLGRPKD